MRLSARLVVLMDTSEIEHLRMLAHERDWSVARMARHMLSNGIKAEVRKREKREMRAASGKRMSAAAAAGLVMLRENGVLDGDR